MGIIPEDKKTFFWKDFVYEIYKAYIISNVSFGIGNCRD